jgi:hypothetical protein
MHPMSDGRHSVVTDDEEHIRKAKLVAVGRGRRSVTAPLHSRAVRSDALNCRSSIIYADFRLYKLATLNQAKSERGTRE